MASNLAEVLWFPDATDPLPVGTADAVRKAVVFYNRGNMRLRASQYVPAIKEYRKGVALTRDYAELRNNLGVALYLSGQYAEGVAEYRIAIDLKPDYAEPHNNLGYDLSRSGRLSEAIAECSLAVSLKPSYAEAHQNLGVALARSGNLAEAIAELRIAVNLKPDSAAAHYDLARTFYEGGQFQEAIAKYRIAINLQPGFGEMLSPAEMHNNLGGALFGDGQLAEAIAEFRIAVDLKPNYVDAHDNLILALRSHSVALNHSGQHISALSFMRELYERTTDNTTQEELGQEISTLHHNILTALDANKNLLGSLPDTNYRRDIMGDLAEFHAAADDAFRRGLSIAEFKQAIEEKLTAKAQGAAYATTKRAKTKPRPDWIKARKQGVTVPIFIKDKFAAELAEDTMHKGLFSRYRDLRRDFYAFQRHHELPDWLKAVPTQTEWNDLQVAEGKITLPPSDQMEQARVHIRDLTRVTRARRRGVVPL